MYLCSVTVDDMFYLHSCSIVMKNYWITPNLLDTVHGLNEL